MLHLFAESFTVTTNTTTASPSTGASIGLFAPLFLFVALMLAAEWKVFVKAGKPGWAALVPIYNTWVLFEITGYPAWIALLAVVPIANIVAIVYGLMATYKLAKLFGKSDLFALGHIFIPVITMPILGFGKATLNGAPAVQAAASAPGFVPDTIATPQPEMQTPPTSVSNAPTAPNTPVEPAQPTVDQSATPYTSAPQPAAAPEAPTETEQLPPVTPPTNPVA